ncbi:MAG TPA: diguanylate cyclase [Syntrophomonadaceae bacterium]|nr:diguanylate cyclase [Syntrophomonadaceae bacterium]HPR92436.1 diguanylate cyclase [Syntrophomonadaceae bacterium]
MKSIGAKLMISFSLVIMVVCIGLGYIASVYASNALHETAAENLITRAEVGGRLIISDMEARLCIVETVAENNAIYGMNWNEQLPVLITENKRLNFKSMGVAAPDGGLKLIDGTSEQISQQEYFINAIRGEKSFSQPVKSSTDDSVNLAFAVPIEREGQIVGVLVGIEDASILSRITNEITYGKKSCSFIVSGDGTILAHPDASKIFKQYNDIKDSCPREVAGVKNLMISGDGNYSKYVLNDGTAMMAGFAPIEKTNWTIGVAAEEKELLAGMVSMKRGIVIASVFAIILALFFAFRVGRTISLPINLITGYYRKMAEGDFSRRLDSTWTGRKDELGALAFGYNTINFNIGQIINKLAESENNLRQITDNMTDIICRVDKEGKFIYMSPSLFAVTGWRSEELSGWGVFDLVHPEDVENSFEIFRDSIRNEITGRAEFRFKTKEGNYKWMEGTGRALYNEDGRAIGGIITCREIEERKKAEKEIQYLIDYDVLTKLYNRSFFERKIYELDTLGTVPVAVLVCDVDGLKLVNDTLGHTVGDKLLLATARLFNNNCPEEATVARVGGDEFAILLPDHNEEKLNKLLDSLRNAIKKINDDNIDMPISISMGYSMRVNPQEKLMEVYKRADEAMYREKLMHSRSNRSAIVEVVMRALEARDYITEGHAERMQNIVITMGEAIGMNEHEINNLCLFARFHDIGKVGVPDQILFKKDKLTSEEFDEMKKHCEIGYRIVQTSPDFVHIADWILKHHEWWDGNGYPLGLKAGDIPLQCRVLAIADAFDAMMNDRPYRKAMDIKAIKLELRRCAGTQFDPILVEYFLNILESQDFTCN